MFNPSPSEVKSLPYSAACHAKAEHSRARLLPLPVGLSSREFWQRSMAFTI